MKIQEIPAPSLSVLFVDIGGFTALTEYLLKRKESGAEEISNIINYVFSLMINTVYKNNGFISTFAGDAFTALFEDKIDILNTAKTIQQIFLNKKHYIKKHNLSIKIGISYGNVQWEILNKKENIYYFKGKPIINASVCEKHAPQNAIVCDKTFLDNCKCNIKVKKIEKDFYIVKDISINKKNKKIKKKIQFIPNENTKIKNKGEIRTVESIFIQYKDFKTHKAFKKFIDNIINLTKTYNGYINLLDFGDKGNLIFIIFGAPNSQEDDIMRSVQLSMDIKKHYKDNIKIGITSGKVFAGIVGNKIRSTYTVLGDKVNMAARFMQMAELGEIIIDEEISKTIQSSYSINYKGRVQLKGKKENIACFSINNKILNTTQYENVFIGREEEKKILNSFLNQKKNKKIMIKGNAGIGKTRLVYEVLKNKKGKKYFFKSDGILKKGLNTIQYFFYNYFDINDGMDRKEQLEKIKEQLKKIDYTNIDMEKILFEEALLKLLNILPINSVFDNLDAKAQFDNIQLAIFYFFSIISGKEKVIFIIDDFQWIDEMSYTIFNKIINNKDINSLFILIAREESNYSNAIKDWEIINLDALSKTDTKSLIINFLGYKPDKKLLDFIINKTESNPFYIEQFAMYLLENNYIIYKNKKSYLKGNIKEIPNTLYSIIVSRLDKLSIRLKNTVQIAAVMGVEFDINVFKNVLQDNNVDLYLSEGIEEDIWKMVNEIKYIFKHTLLRDAAYNMQLKKRLTKLHKNIAEILEKLYKNKKNVFKDIAYHYEMGRQIKKAIEFYEKAGDYYKDIYSNKEAIELYGNAVKLSRDKKKKIELNLKISSIYEVIGEWSISRKINKKILKQAEKINYIEIIPKILVSLGLVNIRLRKFEEGKEVLERVIKNKNLHFDALSLYGAYNNIVILYIYQRKYEKALKIIDNTLKLIKDKKKYTLSCSYLYNNKGLIEMYMGKYKEALKTLKMGNKYSKDNKRNYPLINIANIYFYLNKLELAKEYYFKQLKVANELQDAFAKRVILNNIASIFVIQDNYFKAMEFYKRSEKIARYINIKKGLRLTLTNIAIVSLYLDKFKESEKIFKQALKIAKDMKDEESIIKVYAGLGLFYYETKRYNMMKKTIEELKKWDKNVFLSQSYILDAMYHLKHYNKKTFIKKFNEILNKERYKVEEEMRSFIDIIRIKMDVYDRKDMDKIIKEYKVKRIATNIYVAMYEKWRTKKYEKKVLECAQYLYERTHSKKYENIINTIRKNSNK